MQATVVTPQAAATEVGIRVLEAGGNAADAAVSIAFAQGVLDPTNCGIGGFGSCLIFRAEDRCTYVTSFHARAGELARPEMWRDLLLEEYDGSHGYRLRGFVNSVGYRSIATPGTVAGLASILSSYGSMSWTNCIEPAIGLAERGYALTPRARALFRSPPDPHHPHPALRVTATPAARDIFTRDGHSLRGEGDVLVQKDYARTLRTLAAEGPESFYDGEIGCRIAADFTENGALVTSEDLSAYKVRTSTPIVGSYRGYTVVTDPPPSGGVTLLEMLNVLEGFDLQTLDFNGGSYLNLLVRSMQWAYRDRANYMGDPDFGEIPVARLLSQEYADEARTVVSGRIPIHVPRWRANERGTTHLCVCDQWGNVVSMTHSLGDASGVATEGLGFLYNNAMNCFNPIPGHVNSIMPGKARITGIAPTILLREGEAVMAIGAPGGTRIPTGILQAIVNFVDFGMTPVEAVSAPRVDCQGDTVEAEARIADRSCDHLRKMGHRVVKTASSYWDSPLVHMLVMDAHPDSAFGAADPRGEGMALAVTSQ